MAARFNVQKLGHAVDVPVNKQDMRPARVTQRMRFGIHAASAVVLLTTIVAYSGITRGTNYGHYTSWSFMLAAVYVVSDLKLRRYTSVVLAPLAFAVTQSVACMTAAMYVADAGIIRESLQQHSYAVVSFMNVVLHVVPALIVSVLMSSSRRDIPTPDAYAVKCVAVALVFSATYFLTFSPNHQYKVLVSNTVIRISVIALHSLFALAAAVAIPHKFEK